MIKPFVQTSIFFIVLLLSIIAKAQNKDYVINLKGDTLFCDITKPLFSSHLRYQTSAMNKAEKITTSNIKEYYVSEEKVTHRNVHKAPKDIESAEFMTVIEKGKICLYELVYQQPGMMMNGMMTAGTSTTIWYASKNSKDSLIAIKNTGLNLGDTKSRPGRKKDFAEIIRDNKKVYDKYVADDSFSFDAIRNLVHLYNTGEPYTKTKEPYEH